MESKHRAKVVHQNESKLAEFKFFQTLPDTIQTDVLEYLPLKELGRNVTRVSKSVSAVVKEIPFYKFLIKGQQILAGASGLSVPTIKTFEAQPMNGAIALGEGLITIEQANQFPADQLELLLSDNGLKALREKLFSIKEILNNDTASYYLEWLLSDHGIIAIRENLIKAKELKRFDGYIAPLLLSDYGLIALRDKLITVEQAELFSHFRRNLILQELLTKNGISALREGFITIDQVQDLSSSMASNRINLLLTDHGLILLRAGLISVDEVLTFDGDEHGNYDYKYSNTRCKLVKWIEGLIVKQALEEKLITDQQVEMLDPSHLDVLFNVYGNGLIVLREKLITADQAIQFNSSILRCVISDYGILALKEGFISISEVQVLNQESFLRDLLTKNGLNALRQGVITFAAAMRFKSRDILEETLSSRGVIALRENLIKLDQVQPLVGFHRMDYPYYHCLKLFWLLSNNGIAALRKGLMTFDRAFFYESIDDVEEALSGFTDAELKCERDRRNDDPYLSSLLKREPLPTKDVGLSELFESDAKLESKQKSAEGLGLVDIPSRSGGQPHTDTLPLPDLQTLVESKLVLANEPSSAQFVVGNSQAEKKSIDDQRLLSSIDQSHKAESFRRIYKALRDGQSGFLKTNFLSGKENLRQDQLIAQVEKYVIQYPNSRTAKAWELSQSHYDDCTPKNRSLFTAIYKWSFQKSGIFSRSCMTGITFFSSESLNAKYNFLFSEKAIRIGMTKENTRTANIYKALAS